MKHAAGWYLKKVEKDANQVEGWDIASTPERMLPRRARLHVVLRRDHSST